MPKHMSTRVHMRAGMRMRTCAAITVLAGMGLLAACSTQQPAGTPVINPTTGATEHVASQAQIGLTAACVSAFGSKDATGARTYGWVHDATPLIQQNKLKGTASTSVFVTAQLMYGVCMNEQMLTQADDQTAATMQKQLTAAQSLVEQAKGAQ